MLKSLLNVRATRTLNSLSQTVNLFGVRMTSLELDENKSTYQIRAYRPGTLQINDKTLTHSVIITPNQLIEDWAPQSTAELTPESLQPILALKPTVLLIGTGSAHVLLSPAIYGELINQGIGVEVMDTSAACRTYNALSAEDREVAAALIIK
jgi:uncharacterized protein